MSWHNVIPQTHLSDTWYALCSDACARNHNGLRRVCPVLYIFCFPVSVCCINSLLNVCSTGTVESSWCEIEDIGHPRMTKWRVFGAVTSHPIIPILEHVEAMRVPLMERSKVYDFKRQGIRPPLVNTRAWFTIHLA